MRSLVGSGSLGGAVAPVSEGSCDQCGSTRVNTRYDTTRNDSRTARRKQGVCARGIALSARRRPLGRRGGPGTSGLPCGSPS